MSNQEKYLGVRYSGQVEGILARIVRTVDRTLLDPK